MAASTVLRNRLSLAAPRPTPFRRRILPPVSSPGVWTSVECSTPETVLRGRREESCGTEIPVVSPIRVVGEAAGFFLLLFTVLSLAILA